MTQSASDLIIDRETAQTLLELIEPIYGQLDRQFLADKYENYERMTRDSEMDVIITKGQERDLTQAYHILWNALHTKETPE